MEVELLTSILEKIPHYDDILKSDCRRCEVVSVSDDIRLMLAVHLALSKKRPLLYVVASEDRAKSVYKEARRFFNAEAVAYYPSRELLPYDSFRENSDAVAERVRVMSGLSGGGPFFAVASATTLGQRLMPPSVWRNLSFTLKVGDVISVDKIAHDLVALGYNRESLTEEPGSFSVRGSIVDFYPIGSASPYRLDFFDDEIESLRSFDPSNQISTGQVESVTIIPAAQFLITEAVRDGGLASFISEAKGQIGKLREAPKKRAMDKAANMEDSVLNDIKADYLAQLLPYFYQEQATLLSYLGDQGLLVLDETEDIVRALDRQDEEEREIYSELLSEGEVFPSFLANFLSCDEVKQALNCRSWLSYSFIKSPTGLGDEISFTFPLREFAFSRGGSERGYELRELASRGQLIFCAGDDKALEQMGAFADTWEVKKYQLCRYPLGKSLECSDIPCFFLAARDFFGIVKEKRSARKKDKTNVITSFVDLREGDYVVHENHGIGQYIGMERLTVDGITRDYLHIRYRGEDKLYIPTDQMDMLQKYIGNTDAPPKVNKLGGKEWQTVKTKARGSVREMAQDLLRLYAERSREKGYAFSPDSPWQWEMEGDFPYDETPDQSDAIADIKADMEKEKPMDRLLCGDVGYGKTEVALRAAFKAVLDGKQCAVLVPTTVLAQQHERTFSQRLTKFGVTVRALSRFKSSKEVKDTLSDLAAGKVDVIIGTHMLLGKRVKYKDLGLLIIDEEQRFGVAHKEKIKELKKNIDVLAMSATPIPRTLHMSLLGARDISVIETPPPRRQPVKTYVMEYQGRVVKEAIVREMSRNGQIYYVHNKVEDITAVAAYLQNLVPEARILIGHGQMAERELEKVMVEFMNGNADILLCTTIVESGLDFPNVNTLIVDRGDCLGLAQMYQLRGRVGRSRKQGYAYFFYRGGDLLALPARKRLAAIRDYTDLGSGFKIALRDMEIRGAGNILGPEQHGHIASVGFDMYCRLVNEEVKRLQGQEIEEEREEINIDIQCSAYLPDTYAGDDDVKIELYKKIADLRDQESLKSLLAETEDRFGSIPDSVYNLFLVARLKILGEKLGIVSIIQRGHDFKIVFKDLKQIAAGDISRLIGKFGRRFEFKMTSVLEVTVKCGQLSSVKALLYLLKVLSFLDREAEKKSKKEGKDS